jgi:hypothetical protein
LTLHLEEAASRVSTVAKAHERIHQGNGPDRLDLGVYVRDVAMMWPARPGGASIEVTVEPGTGLFRTTIEVRCAVSTPGTEFVVTASCRPKGDFGLENAIA